MFLFVRGDGMLYNDRKMLKWQGFFLSEHNEALALSNEKVPVEEQQSLDVISKRLEASWLNKTPVNIQQNIMINGSYQSAMSGIVMGYHSTVVYLLDEETNGYCSVPLAEIRHVTLTTEKKWYE